MSIIYITENDKNGRARFYKVIDGKKKVVSRSEYEENVSKKSVELETDTLDTEESNKFMLDDMVTVNETEKESEYVYHNCVDNYTRENEFLEQFKSSFVEYLNEDGYIKDINSKSDVLNDVGEFLLSFTKEIIRAAGSKNAEKTKLQKTKTGKRMLVNYRNCMVFSVALGTDGKIESLRFMGTTDDTRKKGYEFVMNKQEEISGYKNEIIKQVEYIDRWYLSASSKEKAS